MRFRKINEILSYQARGGKIFLQLHNPRRDSFVIPLIKDSSKAIIELLKSGEIQTAERRLVEYSAALSAVLNLFEISLLVSLRLKTNNNLFSEKVREGLVRYIGDVYGYIQSREVFEKYLIDESVRRLIEGDQDG